MQLNPKQTKLLKDYLKGDKVPNMDSRCLGSMWTCKCFCCGKSSLYPKIIGVGLEAQICPLQYDEVVVLCDLCLEELQRRTFFSSFN